ncbi:TrkH family potassium uptake protein [Roseobacter sp. N2S]|uniref:TrkH family potassium uptake protein n=1 Tax=Roseobacter sp. N2S TaxID=2663844 RepID=UPI0028647412|nr:TrkH family potassium uptake protein [Roseobacter sp. N2S]MDR6267172.1 trk system potassium uptake protein TrkH [Roseobacter sp. N2S]
MSPRIPVPQGWRLPNLPPPMMLALLYLFCILLGALLLLLPFANTGGVTLGDAIFTSASAVTVTGLAVVDTGSTFSLFGQFVIMVLIQLGGLGLMSFAVLVLSAMGIPIGMPQRLILREDLNHTSLHNLTAIVRIILVVSLTCELLGTALLAFVFVPEFGWAEGLWNALFHSISAFNNAGFALFPDSLSQWVDDPVINLVIPALFILGGLGFVVVADLFSTRSWGRLTLHSKLMIVGTAIFILFAWFFFAALEWNNPGTLGQLPTVGAKLWASWFQAVTPRTAGFNTLDTSAMHDSTTMMTMFLMIIGGGSASTAGGVKVTTVIVLLIASVAFFRRRTEIQVFGRSLGVEEIMKVMALATVSTVVIFVAIFIVSISHDGEFIDLVFEVTSAFGTVGLSRGATSELDSIGRALIICLMFLGRVGPLTLGFFLATRSVPRVKYPKGQIHLG